MKNYRVLEISSLSLLWFWVLPFPFENQSIYTASTKSINWMWFGGYHNIVTKFQDLLPLGDFATREENSSTYSYSHSWYLLVFFLLSIALGTCSYLIIAKLKRDN